MSGEHCDQIRRHGEELRKKLWEQHNQRMAEMKSMDGFDKTLFTLSPVTPHSYAPYHRKKHHLQVPTTYTTLPPWQPPNPTPPPEPRPSPMDQSTASTPPPQLPIQPQTPTLINDQPSSQPLPVLPIRPLMDITFTPHTILRIKSRLQKIHTPPFHSKPHRFTPPTPQFPSYTLPLLPLLQTLTHLLQTLQLPSNNTQLLQLHTIESL